MSHMKMEGTEENASFTGDKIDMSPIQRQDKDVSAADEAILGVFDKSGSHNKTSKRKLVFEDEAATEKENMSVQKSQENVISNLKNDLNSKMNMIDQLTSQLNYFTKNSKDYSSPRFSSSPPKEQPQLIPLLRCSAKVSQSFLNKFGNLFKKNIELN